MRTSIEIDDRLMAEAQKVSGQATRKATVEAALRLMVEVRRHDVALTAPPRRPVRERHALGGGNLKQHAFNRDRQALNSL